MPVQYTDIEATSLLSRENVSGVSTKTLGLAAVLGCVACSMLAVAADRALVRSVSLYAPVAQQTTTAVRPAVAARGPLSQVKAAKMSQDGADSRVEAGAAQTQMSLDNQVFPMPPPPAGLQIWHLMRKRSVLEFCLQGLAFFSRWAALLCEHFQ